MKLLIPCSGGIDSTYLIAKALNSGYNVVPMFVDDDRIYEKESLAAIGICNYYSLKPAVARIPNLDYLRVTPEVSTEEQEQAIKSGSVYWAGYKGLMYANALSLGTALGVDEVQWGIYPWNMAFFDETKDGAELFWSSWTKLYPDLRTPKFTFPLYERSKSDVILECIQLKVPLELTWTCTLDVEIPCGVCECCKNRAAEFATAEIVDPLLHRVVNKT